jgi:hypothetical protein
MSQEFRPRTPEISVGFVGKKFPSRWVGEQPQTRYIFSNRIKTETCFMYVCKQMRIFFPHKVQIRLHTHVLVMNLYAQLWLVKMPKHVALLKE